jgi:hypothetical protein
VLLARRSLTALPVVGNFPYEVKAALRAARLSRNSPNEAARNFGARAARESAATHQQDIGGAALLDADGDGDGDQDLAAAEG